MLHACPFRRWVRTKRTARRSVIKTRRRSSDRRRRIEVDRVGGTGQHQEWATGGMRKLLGGASVDQASERAIAARAYDQQIERCAVQRQLLGRLTVDRVRFDAAQACDSLKGILDEAPGRASGGSWPNKGV